MSVSPFPHRYSTTLVNDTLIAAPRTPIGIGAPTQFGGTDDVWSPEQLLVGAALSCLKTTFDAYAKHEDLVIHDWRGAGTGVLVKGREGPVFESIELDIELVTDAGHEERTRDLLATAERHCIISRALSAPVHVTARVVARPARAAS